MTSRFLAAALLFLSGLAHAAFPPTVQYEYRFNTTMAWQPYSSGAATCTAYAGYLNGQTYQGRNTWVGSHISGSLMRCSFTSATPSPTTFNCGSATLGCEPFYQVVGSPTGSCPANSTLANGSCSCNGGYTEQTSGGVTYCIGSSCPSGGTVVSTGTTRYSIPGSGSTACINGCLATPEWMYGTGADRWAVGPWTHWGQPCSGGGSTTPTATEQTPEQNRCPVGQCPGTVNGASVCVICAVSNNDVTPGTGSTPGSVTTTTANPNGTVTTSTGNGGSGSGQTGSSESPGQQIGIEGYCLRNPTAFICTGNPSGGAPAGEGGEGEGESYTVPGAGTLNNGTALRTNGTRTVLQALTDVRSGLQGTPIGSAVGGWLSVSVGGSCPTWALSVDYPASWSTTVDFLCSSWAAVVMQALRYGLLILATWFAMRLVLE